MTFTRAARLSLTVSVLAAGLALTGCSNSSYEECMDYMRSEAVSEDIQMNHEDYARNRCTYLDGETPDPNWRDSL